jgi:uncharacterized protein (DUF2147 family)
MSLLDPIFPEREMKLIRATVVLMALCGAAAHAQMTPVGRWQTFEEKTGAPKSIVAIADRNGAMLGKIEKVLRKDADPNAKCTECTDERKDQPIVGLEVLRGARKVEGQDVWDGGQVLDPENGKTYTLKLTPIEGGKKLEVRGSIAFLGRTQTWTRLP